MRPVLLLACFALLVSPLLANADENALGADTSIRIQRVRAFAVESDASVIIREAVSRYRRITTKGACPALPSATRLAFQIGTNLDTAETGGQRIPVTRPSISTQVSGRTPHAALVLVLPEGRAACPIASVVVADEAAFETAKAAHGAHDNRYSGDHL